MWVGEGGEGRGGGKEWTGGYSQGPRGCWHRMAARTLSHQSCLRSCHLRHAVLQSAQVTGAMVGVKEVYVVRIASSLGLVCMRPCGMQTTACRP